MCARNPRGKKEVCQNIGERIPMAIAEVSCRMPRVSTNSTSAQGKRQDAFGEHIRPKKNQELQSSEISIADNHHRRSAAATCSAEGPISCVWPTCRERSLRRILQVMRHFHVGGASKVRRSLSSYLQCSRVKKRTDVGRSWFK